MGSQLPHFIGRVFDMCEQLSHEPKPAKAHHEHIDDLQASADPGATAPTSPTGVGGVKHRIKMAFRPAGTTACPSCPSAAFLP